MIIENYTQLGGHHPETAALTNVLAHAEVVNPATGKPFSEATVLGIGGGLGVGYILWEFKKHETAIITMGYRSKWNYPVAYLQNTCDRLGVKAVFQETGGRKTAAKQLNAALENGQPAIAWIDQQLLPYFGLRDVYSGCFGYVATVIGYDEENDTFILDDKSEKPMHLSAETMAAARGRIGSYKHRLMTVEAGNGGGDLETAVRAGITDCVDYLSSSSQTFALPALTKWAKMMTHAKNKKGWPTVFADGVGLYSSLRSVHEGIKYTTTEGAALRLLYADFLDEAAEILGHPALPDAAAKYRQAGALWTTFADTTLPAGLPAMQQTKTLLMEKYAAWREQGQEGMATIGEINRQLLTLEIELNPGMPLSQSDRDALFEEMQTQLFAIYEAEQSALETLRQVVA